MPTRARTHHRTGRLAPPVALALAALLAGCAPDSAPAPTPAATDAAATTAQATTPPLLPTPAPLPTHNVAMDKDDEAGAVASVDYFLALYAYTESTQDTTRWQGMSHPSCVFCKSVLEHVSTERSKGHVIAARPMLITARKVTKLNPVAYDITVTVTKEPDALWSLDGRLIDPGNDVGGVIDLVVVFQIDQWIVREVSTSDPVTR